MINKDNISIGIVVSKFNNMITDSLLNGAKSYFVDIFNGSSEKLHIFYVPGAFEIPGTINKLLQSKIKFDSIIAIGAIIRGETPHFEYISSESAHGLAQLSIKADIPIINGIITTNNMTQAINRAKQGNSNKGWESMKVSIEMISTYNEIDK
tara:strand:- start:115 stop:570 length:456 start_codon:yes stop_codon:yes gene_type:complete